MSRLIASATPLQSAPSLDSDVVGQLEAGDPFEMLENSVGWAWGYAGGERLVGYVRSEAIDCSIS